MALWTDVIDPATLTGYVREALAAQEARKGSLARWLPNRHVDDIVVRFVAGQAGLVPEAEFRAYDAEPTMGKAPEGKRVILELPAVGQNIPVSEYTQLRNRNASDEQVRNAILGTANQVVQAVSDRMERLRGVVLSTGVATIPEIGAADSFGRDGGFTTQAGTLWTLAATDRLAYLETITDAYKDKNGVDPGVMLTSTRVLRALAAGDQFQTQLLNGGARPATVSDVNAIIEGAGLPPIVTYDRRTHAGKVLADDLLFLLPEPVEIDAWEDTELGATFWGETLSSSEADWGIEDDERAGIVAATYRNPKPPMIAEVISDAIGMPVLANADLSLATKVL